MPFVRRERASRRLRQKALAMAKRRWYALLALPFVGTLIPQFYNHAEPALFGLPFFYWYQLLWVVITSALLGIVFVATREPEDDV